MESSGWPSAPRFSFTSMPSGLLEPTSCRAIKCAATKPSSTSGMAITWKAKKRFRADERDGAKQVDDHLGAPVRHLAPWQQVAEERFGHQAQEDGETEQPDQFAWLAVGAVQQGARHVQVDDDEEGRGARRVHVAHQPAPRYFAHDVLDGIEGQGRIRFVMHGQENAGDDLQDQYQHGQRAEDVPEIEVFRGVVLAPLVVPQLGQGKAVIDPAQRFFGDGSVCREFRFFKSCHDQASPFSSLPISNLVSLRYIWRGTCRLSGAGLFLNTRPAMSKVEPWQGHRKPPSQSSGSDGCGPGANFEEGEQPR